MFKWLTINKFQFRKNPAMNIFVFVWFYEHIIINFYNNKIWLIVTLHTFRVSRNYPGKNILFKIDEASNYPYYLAFVIHYQQGKGDIIAVQLCGLLFIMPQHLFLSITIEFFFRVLIAST